MLGNFKLKDWGVKHIAETITAIWDFTAGLTVTRNNIKNVSTLGIQIKNDTPADAVNTIQQSGYNSWKGALWRTDTSASVNVEFLSELIPVSGTANSAYLDFKSRFASDAFASVMKLYQNGELLINNIGVGGSSGGYGINVVANGIKSNTYSTNGGAYFAYGKETSSTSLNGFSSKNRYTAEALYPAYYPSRIFLQGSAWDTGTVTAVTHAWIMEHIVTSGNPTNSYVKMSYSVDGGAYSDKFFFDKNGNLGIGAASAGEKCEVTGAIKTVYVSDTDSDTDDVLSTGITTKFGLVLIKETTGNKFCLFRIKGDNSAPIIIDGDAEFAAVKDNASTYNFYYETDQFKLQNKVGNDKALYVGLYLV